ncbi:MAG: SufE family protein [Bacteroidales bacterium]|nr:SufE family protein [Bacteroidales bacterium]
MTIEEKEQEIIEEFSSLDEWMDKYNYLIDLGKEIPALDPKFKTDEYLIQGCQSRVWLQAEYSEGKLTFSADSDAIITKGIAALLIRVLTDSTPDDILNAKLSFIDAIGLKEHLSPTRSNGLVSMLKQMRYFALAYKTKNSN